MAEVADVPPSSRSHVEAVAEGIAGAGPRGRGGCAAIIIVSACEGCCCVNEGPSGRGCGVVMRHVSRLSLLRLHHGRMAPYLEQVGDQP
jgi:hypothetical protein